MKKVTSRGVLLALATLLFVLTAAASLALTACGASDEAGSGSTSASPGTTTGSTRDNTVYLEEDWPTYIDPAVGTDFSDLLAVNNINDALVFLKNDNTLEPWLATSWEMSEDGLTWTFKLREGVKFHNGEEMKASDVVFTLKRLQTVGEGVAFLFTQIESAKAIDDYTVEFKLKKPFGPFLNTLVRFYVVSEKEVMAHLEKAGPYGEYGDFGKKWGLTHDFGCGPYMASDVKMEEYILMEKFDQWWGGWDKNAPKYFKMYSQPDPAAIRAQMSAKQLDLTDEWQALETYDALAEIPGVTKVRYQVGHNYTLKINCTRPPTDDVHFRRALAYSLDYAAIVDPETGIAPGSVPSVGPVVNTLPGWSPDLKTYSFDLEKAKEELAQSKYASSPGQYPVRYTYAQEVPWTEKIALMMQSYASQVGIKFDIVKEPVSVQYTEAQKKETTPNIYSVIDAPLYPEAGGPIYAEMSSHTQGGYSNTHWLGTSWDAKIEDALSKMDETERFAKYAKLQQEIIDFCPTIWVFDQLETRAAQTGFYYWPVMDLKAVAAAPGYPVYAHDMRIYPEKLNE